METLGTADVVTMPTAEPVTGEPLRPDHFLPDGLVVILNDVVGSGPPVYRFKGGFWVNLDYPGTVYTVEQMREAMTRQARPVRLLVLWVPPRDQYPCAWAALYPVAL